MLRELIQLRGYKELAEEQATQINSLVMAKARAMDQLGRATMLLSSTREELRQAKEKAVWWEKRAIAFEDRYTLAFKKAEACADHLGAVMVRKSGFPTIE
jgi:hypothetical protein